MGDVDEAKDRGEDEDVDEAKDRGKTEDAGSGGVQDEDTEVVQATQDSPSQGNSIGASGGTVGVVVAVAENSRGPPIVVGDQAERGGRIDEEGRGLSFTPYLASLGGYGAAGLRASSDFSRSFSTGLSKLNQLFWESRVKSNKRPLEEEGNSEDPPKRCRVEQDSCVQVT